MKNQIISLLILAGILIFFFNACNSDSSTNPIDNQSSSNQNLSKTELLAKMAYGQTLLLEAKKTDKSTFDAAAEKLKASWEEFKKEDLSSSAERDNLIERIGILEEYFPSLIAYSTTESGTKDNSDYITTGCEDGRCGICGHFYFKEEGDLDQGILPGTSFFDLAMNHEDWVCPTCGAGVWEYECFSWY